MDKQEIRSLILQRSLTREPLNISLQGLEMLDGQLAVQELPVADVTEAQKLATRRGELDEGLLAGILIAKGLVMLDSGERIFADTDGEALSRLGVKVLMPVATRIMEVCGLTPDALALAKKN
jgi:hypothetical protein